MMDFFTKLLTPVFIALGLVNPTPIVEMPTQDILLQQEVIELRQKAEEFQGEEEIEVIVDTKKEEVLTTKSSSPVNEVVPQPKSSPQANFPKENKEQVLAPIKFEFKDIKAKTSKEEATINWATTFPSESRLVIHKNDYAEIFPSDNINSTEHQVTINGLKPSLNYTYELIAKNDREEISRFDKFYTEQEFKVKLKNKGGCYVFVVEDTAGKPLVGGTYKISASNNSISYGTTEVITDKNGELKYCKNVNKIRITDSNNEEVYPNPSVN